MTDILRIYVLWHPESTRGAALAARIAAHFDGLGMERDGVGYRVPVRFRSTPWQGGADPEAPRAIDLDLAKHNAIILLHDAPMRRDEAVWDAYVLGVRAQMGARGTADCYIPFQGERQIGPLKTDAASFTQYARQFEWPARLGSTEACETHALLHILFAIRYLLRSMAIIGGLPETLFVSHAKVDGDETARAIINYVNDPNQDIPYRSFYDAKQLMPGYSYQAQFQAVIAEATLLAIVSDVYDSRPWCVFELTEAKRARRPIVMADIGQRRISRTYPYGANVPRVKFTPTDSASIETLLLEVLSEGLRCDVFQEQAQDTMRTKKILGLALPRPPELYDIIARPVAQLGAKIIYPDPPLADIEAALVKAALAARSPNTEISSLGEL